LVAVGWDQGVLIETCSGPRHIVVWEDGQAAGELGEHSEADAAQPTWTPRQIPIYAHDYLVLISHPCDIAKSPSKEPHVEFLPANWTSDKGRIHSARRNSSRYYLLQTRRDSEIEEGLIADASLRVMIEKSALLTLSLERCPGLSGAGLRKFRTWLGKRHNRPALPDEIVDAVQKPIVEGIRDLRKKDPKDPRIQVLDGMREVLYWLHGGVPPYEVEFVFICREMGFPSPSDRDAIAPVVAWMSSLLEKRGKAKVMSWQPLTLHDISAYDYIAANELPLDEYSLVESDENGVALPSWCIQERGSSQR